MRKTIMLLVSLLAVSSFASAPKDIFSAYEQARAGLINDSLAGVQAGARQLAAAAKDAKQNEIAGRAAALATAKDLASARDAFGAVSDEVVKFRKAQKDGPAVAYCSMKKKSWLQPKGEISNPYYDASMRKCGEFK